MKKFLTIFFISILFFSCASMQNIYTIMADYGQLYFIRSTKITKLPKVLKSFDFDITVRTDKNGEIIDNPIVNYTFVFDKNHYDCIEKSQFYFINKDETILPADVNIIFKEIGDNKNLTVRFTSTISKEEFDTLIRSPSESNIYLEVDGESITQENKAFTQKLIEIGVLI